MLAYSIRRLFGALAVMWAVATLVFFMIRLVPGDPFAAMLFDASPEMADVLRKKYGLDQSLLNQYLKWFLAVCQGDLGKSIYGSRQDVSRLILEALPRTISLSVLSFVIAIIIAVPAGLLSATNKNTRLDDGVTFIAFLGLSMPDFWLATVLIIVFAANLHWLPAIGYVPLSESFWGWLEHLILPAIAAGTAFSAIIARMIRSSMLQVLNQDYITVARAKGLTENYIVLWRAFPNALIPVITIMGIAFALLMTSSVVVENVFAIKGIGRLLIQGILNRDYAVVQGTILIVAAIFVSINYLVDMLYLAIDPRIRY